MQRFSFLNFFTRSLTVFVGCWMTICSPASASPSPVDVQVSLVTAPTITQGEPIILRCRIHNTDLEQSLGVHLGIYQTDWYSMTLTDASGRVMTSLPELLTEEPPGLHAGPNGFIAPNGVTENYIVVTNVLAPPHPGRYILTVHARLPYCVLSPMEESPLVLANELGTAGTVVNQDFTLPILVTLANPSRLQEAAEALRKVTLEEKNGALHRALMEALFSMPQAQAAASWEVLACKPGMDTDIIARYLEHVHSPKSADILALMLRNSALSSDNVTAVSRHLNRMYNTGDAALRAHIKQIAASDGIALPEQVMISQPVD